MVAWGSNEHGQITVPSGNDYIAVGAGKAHNVALKKGLDLMEVPSQVLHPWTRVTVSFSRTQKAFRL